VLDNCAIHHSDEVYQLIEIDARMFHLFNHTVLYDRLLTIAIVECRLLFLPPYSPDYNPIEEVFASVKAWMRHHDDDHSLSSIGRALRHITPEMAAGWYCSSGYI